MKKTLYAGAILLGVALGTFGGWLVAQREPSTGGLFVLTIGVICASVAGYFLGREL